ncbi:MAG TPA: phosphoribosylaminoimidazolesuccinocarboxamide synthase [Trueperaceae bacterium]|nr:phosphoribosylaminoimidazolesuccinocarboxamide synthase [Trueperaceae bacterium]
MNAPERGRLLYEGKAKRVYESADPALLLVEYKDDATAFNAKKRGTIRGKGAINNAVSERLFQVLEAAGVPTHLVGKTSATEQLVRAVEIVPIEVVVRNRAAGSFAQRYGVEEGLALEPIVVEWCYKNDALGDPPLNDASAVALGLASEDELATMFELAAVVNDTLRAYFAELGLELVDFKLEFGRTKDGSIVLADEISGDTCRLWDVASGERLDKDRFRRDLGGVEEAYNEVHRRVMSEAGAPARFAAVARDREDEDVHEHDLEHEHGHEHDHEHDHDGHDDHDHQHAAVVNVMLKRSILDPQGRAVQNTLERLGHRNIVSLRVGKRIEIVLTGETGEVAAQLDGMASSVLSNPVMEVVEVDLAATAGADDD